MGRPRSPIRQCYGENSQGLQESGLNGFDYHLFLLLNGDVFGRRGVTTEGGVRVPGYSPTTVKGY